MLPVSGLRGCARSSWLAVALVLLAGPTFAQNPPGSPAFGWNALRKCELVVAARYKSHEGGNLSLEVHEVLRGKSCKAGDVLTVKVGPALTLEVNPPPAPPKPPFAVERDASYRLTGPVQDLGPPLLYFFPKETAPALMGTRQIQPSRPGWKEALASPAKSLAFRVTLDRQSELYKEALAELYRTRDAAAIARLLKALDEPYGQAQVAERILRTLGDRGGDLYEPTLKAIKGIAVHAGRDEWLVTRLGRILARADSKRAHGDLATLLKDGSPQLKCALVRALPALESEAGLNLIFAHFRVALVEDAALEALLEVMYPDRYDKRMATVQMAKLQDVTVRRMQKALKNGEIQGNARQQAMVNGNFRGLIEGPKHFVSNPQGIPSLPMRDGPLLKTLPARDPYPQQQVSDNVERKLKNDIVSGRKMLAEALVSKEPLPPGEKEHLAWLISLYGDPDWAPQGKQPLERAVRFRDTEDNYAFRREPLSVFLKKLDAASPMASSPQQLNPNYTARLLALYPDHMGEYFKRVAALITSDNLSEREYGLYCLECRFAWKFDLDAADPVPALARKLEEVRPLWDRMSRGSLLEVRGVLLGHFGVKLDGPPGKGWLPVLEKAACSWNPTTHLNALRVLSMLVGDPDKIRHVNAPLSTRAKELKDHLATGHIYPHPTLGKELKPLSPASLQTLWGDLASDDEATGSRAMQELLTAPDSTLAFLRKKLTVPPAPDAKRSARLIADLGSATFKVRDQANRELKKLGEGVVPHLRRELDKSVPLEVRRRIEELLNFYAAGRVGLVRALQVLENLPGNTAWDVLEALAAGPADASLTREAHGSLRRVRQYWQW